MTIFPVSALLAIALLLPLLCGAAEQSAPDTRLIDSFATLSTMRPRACPGQPAPKAPSGWTALPAQCAWQGRLRVDRWSAPAVGGYACVGPAALWWAGARQRHSGKPFGAWQTEWTSQILRDDSGATKRLAVIRLGPDGRWHASEWTWLPSERADTRLWQQGRWSRLAAQAGHLAQASRIAAGAPAAPLLAVWEQENSAAPSEIRGGVGYWPLQNKCMVLDMVGIADSRFQLPYLLEDSRLEQRSAMQVQLARRSPQASWLRKFQALPVEPDDAHGAHGRASYIAVWREADWIRGQVWLPTKGSGPVLRMRIGTRAAGVAPAAREANAALIEQELASLARRWRSIHD